MDRLKFLQQKIAKARHYYTLFISAVVAVIIPFYFLITVVKSEPSASAAFIDWLSTSDRTYIGLLSGSAISQAYRGRELRNRNEALYIAASRDSEYYVHLGFRGENKMFVQAGPAETLSLFRWRCNIPGSGSFTIGYAPYASSSGQDTECKYGQPGSSWLSQTSDTQNTYAVQNKNSNIAQTVFPKQGSTVGQMLRSQEAIIVSPATERATLYQARYRGRRLVLDVIAGAVTITTPQIRKQVEAGKRYTYTYFSGGRAQESNRINPDQQAIDSFLDSNQWSSLSTQIKELEKEIPPASPNLSDLSVKISAPATATAGSDIGSQLRVVVSNTGKLTAVGTNSAGSNGYMVDIILSSDTNTPSNWAIYSPNYREDVLLRGGRISNTKDLPPQRSESYRTRGVIPADTPPGNYNICAKVDAGNKITESNEANNVSCVPIRITAIP